MAKIKSGSPRLTAGDLTLADQHKALCLFYYPKQQEEIPPWAFLDKHGQFVNISSEMKKNVETTSSDPHY